MIEFQQDNEFSVPELVNASYIPVGSYLYEKSSDGTERLIRIVGIRQSEDSCRLLLDGHRFNGKNYYPMTYRDSAMIAYKREFEAFPKWNSWKHVGY